MCFFVFRQRNANESCFGCQNSRCWSLTWNDAVGIDLRKKIEHVN
jgi:hypothetical protein